MLTLMLLRHAKAAPAIQSDDFDRDLTASGRADAAKLGANLRRMKYRPTLALISAAKRTVETYEIVARGLAAKVPARPEHDLYNATAEQIFQALERVDASVETLLVVGHNPGVMEAAMAVATEGDKSEIERLRDRFPPCAMAVVTFADDNWHDVRAGRGRLASFLMPESLPQPD